MSVLIKGMKMPKHCIDCPMKNNEDDCLVQELQNWKDWDSMKAGCPLVEVPTPHGRLADCDAVKECLHEVTDCDDKIYALGLLEWAVAKRTVIEAEVEE